MKKTLSMVFAAALAAAIFFGCSNSSSDNTALLLAMASSGSAPDRTGLPENVGDNVLAGKTFKRTDASMTYKWAFGSDTVTYSSIYTTVQGVPATTTTYAYSYNATTKQLFLKVASNNSQDILSVIGHFTTDAEFISAFKNFYKQLGSYTDEQLESMAKNYRSAFYAYGYNGTPASDPVPDRIIAKCNAGLAETKTRNKLVEIKAFDLSGSTFKLLSDSRIPAGKGLNEIYGVYGVTLTLTQNSTTTYYLSYSSMPSVTPDIVNAAGNAGFRVSSISANAINTSAAASGSGSHIDWTFTPAAGSINYNTNKTTTSGVFTIPGLGETTVTYATADNVPNMTSAEPWTQE